MLMDSTDGDGFEIIPNLGKHNRGGAKMRDEALNVRAMCDLQLLLIEVYEQETITKQFTSFHLHGACRGVVPTM
jgi:hypothetical protein